VTKSFNTNANVDDVLTFVEHGGFTTKGAIEKNNPGKIIVPEEQKNDPVEVVLNNVPVMKKNEKVVIFGIKSTEKLYLPGEEYYKPLGVYQGKFMVNNGAIKRLVPEVDQGSYPSLEMSIVEMEKRVKEKN
ncbi:MAG: hypothetical protein K0S80_4747, partial [Neobacillus sp.]|nr:hypothetical protein [Neobacillus sp.]